MEKQSDDALLKLIWDYMSIETPLAHADAIVVAGSADMDVAAYAAELYGTGFAPLLVFSGAAQPGTDTAAADLFAKVALSRGVPDSAILREPHAINAGQTIILSQRLLAKQGITPTTIILVHKPYMSRSFLATAEAQWARVKPVFIARREHVSFVEYVLKHGRGETFRQVLGDFQRLRPYAKKGFQSPQLIPNTVQTAYDMLLRRGHKTR